MSGAERSHLRASVIVPTHDRRPALERKLRALEPDAEAFEVVVVADGCSDDTHDFLTEYAPPYPLRWVRSDGRGAAHARNRGAALATAPVLVFSDDDVVGRSGWLAGNVRAHREPGVVGLSPLVRPAHLTSGATRGTRVGWWACGGGSISLRRELFHAVGGYDESFSRYGGEDPELGYRLWRAGARFEALGHAVAEHWDEHHEREFERKAQDAAHAHVRVWQRHGDDRIAWALGVHPLAVAVKRAVLAVAPAGVGRWERAYLQGVREALTAPGFERPGRGRREARS
jgi:GT2 family glycosyltransferase